MEIFGENAEGKVVKADFGRFATDNAGENEEFYGFGDSMAHARYRNKLTGEDRMVDLRELAAQGGLKNPQVRYNPDSETAKQWTQKREIDQGVAYNLERIKSDDAKKMYLQEKGYKTFFNQGDDFFAIEDGYVVPINNKDGLDLSDFTRLGAHAGRDVGAALGVTATGVGAAATGGASLLAAGAAGTGGAVLGEWAQRGIDKMVGADAAKYNAQLGASEEALEMLKTGGIGAAQGLGGQVLSRGFGAAKTAVANKAANMLADTSAGEFMANYAAKAESSYLAAQLPSGWMAKIAGSAEEARALSLLKSTIKEDAPLETIKKVNQEAAQVIRGAAKPTAEEAVEMQTNKTIRTALAQKQAQAIESEEAQAAMAQIEGKAKEEFTSRFREAHYENAKSYYKGSKIDVDEVFREGGDLAKTEAIVREAEVGAAKRLQSVGAKDAAIIEDGRLAGVDTGKLAEFSSNKFKGLTTELGAKADKQAQDAFIFDKIPTEYDKAFAAKEIERAIGMAEKGIGTSDANKGRILENLRYLKDAIGGHDALNQADIGYAFRKFAEEARNVTQGDMFSPSIHNAMEHASNVMFDYASKFAENPAILNYTQQLHSSAMGLGRMIRNEVHAQDGGLEFMLGHYDAASRLLGDNGAKASEIAFAFNFPAMLNGTKDTTAWKFMNDSDRVATLALMGVRNWEKLGIKKTGKANEKGFAAAADEILTKSQSFVGDTYRLGKVGLNAAGKAASATKKVAKVAANIPGVKPISKRTAQYYGISGAEEAFVKKLQNKFGTSDNED